MNKKPIFLKFTSLFILLSLLLMMSIPTYMFGETDFIFYWLLDFLYNYPMDVSHLIIEENILYALIPSFLWALVLALLLEIVKFLLKKNRPILGS